MKILLIIFLLYWIILYSETDSDLSSRIIIDGVSDDFTPDENILVDSLGIVLESPYDSFWGEYNDLHQIKVTWDENNLYVAVDGCSWDNNVILYFDIYDDYGIENMRDMNTWVRAFKFYNQSPDFFLATWDTNDNPQFWQLQEGTQTFAEQVEVEDHATFNTGNLNGSMETGISWSTLYYSDERSMQNYPSIKFVAVLTTGGDNLSGPDAVPDNLGGMSNDSGQICIIDNYAEILIDADGDGNADMGVEPNTRVTYFEVPPVEAIPLEIVKVEFPNGKVFPISQVDEFSFKVLPNRISQFQIEIFNLEGKFINYADFVSDVGGDIEYKWNGQDNKNRDVPFGIYVLRVVSDSEEVSSKKAIVVIK